MFLNVSLIILAIGLPLAGALAVRLMGQKRPHIRHWLAVIIFGASGLIALALFLIEGQFACILASGRQNCLWDGLATLSLFLWSLGLAVKYRIDYRPGASPGSRKYMMGLLLIAGWAGMGLVDSLLVWLISWGLFSYVIYRWLKMRGLNWGYMVIRDDYKDDGPFW